MSDEFDDLIPRIYEAALEPEHWPDVIQRISRLTGHSVVYFCYEPITRFGVGQLWTHNFDRSLLKKGTEEDWTPDGNRSIAAVTQGPVGVPIDRRAIFDDAAYLRSPSIRKVMLPQDLFHAVLAAVQRRKDTVSAAWIARSRRQGPIEGDLLTRFEAMLPHLGTAMRVHDHLHRVAGEVRALRGILDRLGVATVLVDHDGRVRYANPAAERILRAADGLRLTGGRLVPAGSAARRQLEALLGRNRTPARNDSAGAGDHVVVPRPSGSPAYGLFVAPAVGTGATGWVPGVCAIVFITDPAREPAAPAVEWLCQQFGLTRAEAEVARLVAQGHGLPQVAQTLGVTLNTAKTHLKAIYGKTGTDRQARLARLILASASPLA